MSTWFHHTHRDEEIRPGPLKKCVCPVCKEILGLKSNKEIKSFDCKECNTEFTFYPNCSTPTSKVHSLEPKICNCHACKSRRMMLKE